MQTPGFFEEIDESQYTICAVNLTKYKIIPKPKSQAHLI